MNNGSRSLDDLYPPMKEVAEEFLEQCAEIGIEVLIYCTYRSNAEQNKLYAKGRTEKGKIVTNAKGGKSKHNLVDATGKPSSKAFDCVPRKGAALLWSDLAAYEKMGEIGRGLGLTWGGDWKMKDRPHFEWKD
jgi:peptidoglycan LD-endopeptidase CwlK